MLDRIKINWNGSFASFLCWVLHSFSYWKEWDGTVVEDGDDLPVKERYCNACKQIRLERVTWTSRQIIDYYMDEKNEE